MPEDGYDDLSVGMGIDWEDLLPLLIHNGLLDTTEQTIACDYRVSRDKWQALAETSEGKLQMGHYRSKHMIGGKCMRSCEYFICNGKPIYNSPTKQLQEVKKGHYNYLRVRYAGSLKREVSSHATDLAHALYMNRCDNDDTTTTTTTNTTTCLLYTSPSPRDHPRSRMPSSA